MRDALAAGAALAGILVFLRLAVWPLARRLDRNAPITLMATLMDDVERRHREKTKSRE